MTPKTLLLIGEASRLEGAALHAQTHTPEAQQRSLKRPAAAANLASTRQRKKPNSASTSAAGDLHTARA